MTQLVVWTEPVTDSNCYLLGSGTGCVVIDPNDPKRLLEILSFRGWAPERILLTHEHCDHMAGLNALRTCWPSVQVIANELCSRNLQNTRLNMTSMMELYLTFHGKSDVSYSAFTCEPADLTYEKEYTMVWRGNRLRCVSLPGHSPGSVGIFWNEDAFFSGDYLIQGEGPVLRLPGGSLRDYEAITKPFLEKLPRNITIYPGHGPSYRL